MTAHKPTSTLVQNSRCSSGFSCLVAGTSTVTAASTFGAVDPERQAVTGMVLPFEPLTLSFRDLDYYVPLPPVSGRTMCCAC